ncbi:DUF262 and DUF1524 domain-containing protein [Paracoccus sp. (in: a-proteobacteria)]|uniref:DUF262 and DUF1524 domain-containing protein n=1 Tax=Paracoccus sp. TaxID=267 RepID=UPI002AFF7950|nr:DUF262 and DUF1524 domain-containing protein [Paracoccus sp. (in: a-proteobacteria)]
MKATETKLLEFLKKSPQFVIPIYQRTYSWTEPECRQLWNDIIRAGNQEKVSGHFIGSIVYIEAGLYQVTSQSPLLVIDGQQRLTSVMLILEALARALGEDEEPIDGFSREKIRSYFLLNPLEKGDRRYKLLLTQGDRPTLLTIMQQKPLPEDASTRVADNFALFEGWIKELKGDVTALCAGLAKLMVVDIALTRDQDNPQLIFESMNSTGKELSQADLIRNFVLMGLEPDHQTRIYEDHWRPMEVLFPQDRYGSHFDAFMRHYLTLRMGEIPNLRDVYSAFKEYANEQDLSGTGVDTLVADVHALAGYYARMALGKEPDQDLADAFRDLRELKVDVAFPFLLELYHDYEAGALTKGEFVEVVRLVESYVFRRAVCAIPTNSLNKTFATFGRALRKDRYVESVKAHFLSMPSYRRFPHDEEFRQSLAQRDLYNFPRRSYWLRRLENHGRKELVLLSEYTIEHIMPQNENLSAAWRAALGPDWKAVQDVWLHTIGNLTLTKYNSEYGDRPFAEKRDMPGGFGKSPLNLNEELGQLQAWNLDAIQRRAERLTGVAVGVWTQPSLSQEVLDQYQSRPEPADRYSLADHPNVAAGGPMQGLFEALRKEIVALDPAVTEEFLKTVIAYKAETNFVDVEAQARRLKLILNMKFPDLDDPRGIAIDVSNVGHLGSGDVAVPINDHEDLPYVMGLIRQSLEQQLANAVD